MSGGFFVTGTGDGAGADVVAAVIGATLSARGERVALADRDADLAELHRAVRAESEERVIVEAPGGLLELLSETWTVRDLAATLGLPLVVAARPGPDTVNHTLLTLAAARARGLGVAGVVLTPWPARPAAHHETDAAAIARHGNVDVAMLRYVADRRARTLARAGAGLPLGRWLADGGAGAFAPRRSMAA